MEEVQWIKLYIDMFDKRKINKIRRLPAGNDILLIWIMLLALAGKCNAGGMIYITERVPFTEEDLADELDFEVTTIRLALEAFEKLDMIEKDKDGFISLLGWEEYQNVDRLAELREYNRLAQQKSRAKKKLLNSVKNDVNDKSMTSQRCQDIEEEGDKDKEKEFHSFTLANADKEKLECLGGELGQGYVMLSEEQMSDLLDKLSIDEFNKYVSIVAECEKKGKRFKKKSHYQAILDMVAKDRKVEGVVTNDNQS